MKNLLIGVFTAVALTLGLYAVEPKAAEASSAKTPAKSSEKSAQKSSGKKTLVDARADIGKVIENPKEMTEVIKDLSTEDRKAFIAEVNAAITSMPGSAEGKTAKFIEVNYAALKGVEKGELKATVAEVFATVPPEHLTAIAEHFGREVFNRAADPSVSYTDAQFTKVAVETMEKVNNRTEQVDNGEVRSAIAALMFITASNGTSEELIDSLVATLPAGSREIAKNEWIPAAIGANGRTKSYEPLLAAADAGTASSNPEVQLIVSPAQVKDAMLADLSSSGASASASGGSLASTAQSASNYQVPTLGGEIVQSAAATVPPAEGGDVVPVNPSLDPEPQPQPEPGPYGWQSTNN